jgi:hypothetical protein
MTETLLPQHLDNNYQGRKLALWIFGLVVLLRSMQSVMIIFNGYYTARNADGIPLETYPAAATQTILALFAVFSFSRLVISLICLIVLVRYRRAIPFMFIVLAILYLGGQLIYRFLPLDRVGSPPGVIVNLISFALIVIGFGLSLWKAPAKSSEQ